LFVLPKLPDANHPSSYIFNFEPFVPLFLSSFAMKVLLIGHACGPDMGSEPGFTWNWAQHLSRHHEVRVITHPQFRTRIEAYLRENPNPNVQFVWVDVKSALDTWNPAQGERGIRLHYLLWLKEAYAAARKLCEESCVEIAHHVSWGTMRAAPPLWQLPVPSIWGPIGGGQCAPAAFLRYFGLRAGQEILRTCLTRTLYFSRGFRKTAQSSDLILATNRETQRLLKSISGADVQLMLDCGLQADWVSPIPPADRSVRDLTLLWVGRLEHRKALPLALEALASVRGVQATLLVAGSGPLRSKLEIMAAKLGLGSRVEFLGSVPYTMMQSLFERADLFLFTSLRDSFGSVVLEAMAKGLPIITLDHQGVGSFVPNDAGVKVPVTNPKDTVRSLAAAIENLGQSPAALTGMRLASWCFAKEQTWSRRAEQMTGIYQKVASHRNQNPTALAGQPSDQSGVTAITEVGL
jgi:glycosyltransferase involved in cell wall biosynthesis